ncbi:MAG TPA: S53 family peptidase [Acidimicrobiales bacterium]|nr:S53 family peptidase [Acidimicrobiales bacterium]
MSVPTPRLRRTAARVSAITAGSALVALPLLGALAPAAHAAGTDYASTAPATVPGLLPGLARATRTGSPAPGQVLSIGIGVAGADPAAATAFAAAQQDPSSPYFHQWLTPAQYAAEFGVPADREQALVAWLRAGGLHVDPTDASGLYVTASGTVAQLQALFHVTEGTFTAGSGTGAIPFVANLQAPQVPSGFGVTGITGLDTLHRFYTNHHTDTSLTPADRAALVTRAHDEAKGVPDPNAPIVATSTAQPRDLWSIYDQPAADTGQGQTAGVFGEGESDSVITQLRLFESTEGLPKVPVKVVRTEGDTTNDADYGDDTPQIEWFLDVQALTGMAPDLSQLDLYFATSLYDHDVIKDFSTWAADPNGPAQMNASFGECEEDPTEPVTGQLSQIPYGSELGDELEAISEPVLQQATIEGRTLFASAGDNGSGCPAVVVPILGAGNGVAPQPVPLVNYPASSRYAVGVGGTVLTFTGSGASAKRTGEGSWTDTGGGPSHFITEPGFQTGVKAVDVPCVSDPTGTSPNTSGQICRGVPDVAALSGNITGNGYFIYIDGAPSAEGGTSLSSPLTVGMWTRVQAASRQVSASGVKGLGFAAPALYSLYDFDKNGTGGSYGKDFFDVTTEESGATNGAYSPQPGWDYTSGLGVMNVAAVIDDLDHQAPGKEAAVAAQGPTEAPAVASCTATDTSPAGNAVNPYDVSLGNDPAADLTSAHFAVDRTGKDVVVTITGPDFTDPDRQAPTGGETFTAYWLDGADGNVYDVSATYDEVTGTLTAADGTTTGTAAATGGATATLSADKGTLTLTAPLADVGSPASGTQLLYPAVTSALNGAGATTPAGSFSDLSLVADRASADGYQAASTGQAVQVGPCTPAGSGSPTAALPESPLAVGLPAAGVLAGMAALVLVRRRRLAQP